MNNIFFLIVCIVAIVYLIVLRRKMNKEGRKFKKEWAFNVLMVALVIRVLLGIIELCGVF